jgi:hypothetical protein
MGPQTSSTAFAGTAKGVVGRIVSGGHEDVRAPDTALVSAGA